MSGINDLMNTIGGGLAGSIGGAIGNQLGYGLGELTGYNNALDQRQLKQQQALIGMQSAANYSLMKGSYEQQKAMWDSTNAEAQIAHYKAAGLNPALMYAKGGAGGSTGSGSASVGGGQAANAAQTQQANTAQAMSGMAMMKLQSEVKVNEATANKLNADAQTTNTSRDYLVEELRQRGKQTWLSNLMTEWKMEGNNEPTAYTNKNVDYGGTGISPTGLFNQQQSAELSNILSNIDKQVAETLLYNTKAKGYWQELANATKLADSKAIEAAATKLAAEFNYGEYTNWKYWAQLGSNIIKIIK
jgi:hypothetical protein